ncbi:MAG: PIG-L family deacetylase [Parcubacteria group bacterium]|nr:PIG-L family deacetylase [Parcubacteria group bacterium]
MNILVIASHADDEVLGCGGSIAQYVKDGHHVYVCIVTSAYTPDWSAEFITNRRREIEDAHRILQIKKTFLLDLPAAKLDTIPQKELNNALLDVVKEINPDVVLLPHGGDLNKDHRLVFEAGLVATRPLHGLRIQKILCYETVSETEWGRILGNFVPTYYVGISQEGLQVKLGAMKAYSSEMREYPHPRSLELLEALAKVRGSEAGVAVAEAFMLVRGVEHSNNT